MQKKLEYSPGLLPRSPNPLGAQHVLWLRNKKIIFWYLLLTKGLLYRYFYKMNEMRTEYGKISDQMIVSFSIGLSQCD